MKLLLEILSMKRPHGGANEVYLATGILARLPHTLMVFNDKMGDPMAYFIETDPDSTTLFTSHLDTVHKEGGANPVCFDEELGWMCKEDGTPLGADDGAGVWLMYRMIEAGVKGTFLFTLGEEKGGIGARWMADHQTIWLSKFDRAIAFDRKGDSSVITHQGWGRCCSDDFAEALSEALSNVLIPLGANGYAPNSTGVYTDTAEFTSLISECTNLSCGYRKEHTGGETLDTTFVQQLLEACIKLDWAALPASRDPKVVESGYGSWWQDYKSPLQTANDHHWRGLPFDGVLGASDLIGMSDTEIYNMAYSDTEMVAQFLCDLRDDMMDDGDDVVEDAPPPDEARQPQDYAG